MSYGSYPDFLPSFLPIVVFGRFVLDSILTVYFVTSVSLSSVRGYLPQV